MESVFTRTIEVADALDLVTVDTLCLLQCLLETPSVQSMLTELGVNLEIIDDALHREILDCKNRKNEYARGDVILVTFARDADKFVENLVREPIRKHPAIVISKPNSEFEDLIVIPLTTQAQGPHSVGPIEAGTDESRRMGLHASSYACCDVVATIQRNMIVSRIGETPRSILKDIERNLLQSLGLDDCNSLASVDEDEVYRRLLKLPEEKRLDLLARLSPRGRDLITLRLGSPAGTRRTCAEVASLWGVNIERVRLVQARAFRKLRS